MLYGVCMPSLRGAAHPNAKLTLDQVRSILEKHEQGASRCSLAREFGVSPTAIWHILRGSTWTKRHEAESPHVRFWKQVEKTDGCWLWTGRVNQNGYGVFTVKKKPYLAHRYSFETERGKIPGGLYVLHTCDVRRCVRPDHLWVGTAADNARDMVVKRRCFLQLHPEVTRGERNGNSKLKEVDVRRIVALCQSGVPHELVAGVFGITQTHVSRIVAKESWKHVA